MRLLSLDIPWGADGFLGVASAVVHHGVLQQGPFVDSVPSLRLPNAPGFPIANPEVAGFIQNGAGAERVHAQGINGARFDHLAV